MVKHPILRIALIVSLACILPLLWTGVQAEDVNRSSLPIPDQPFKGKIGLRPSDSVTDFPKEVTAPIPPWVSAADAVDPVEGYDWELYNITEAKLTEEQLRQHREGRVKAAMAQ